MRKLSAFEEQQLKWYKSLVDKAQDEMFAKDPHKDAKNSGLRQSQTFWANQHIREGGKSWYLFRVGRDFTILIDGENGKKLLDRPAKKEVMAMAAWHKQGNVTSDDWIELSNVIAC